VHKCQLVLSRWKLEAKDILTLQHRFFIKSYHTRPLFLCPDGVPHHNSCRRPEKKTVCRDVISRDASSNHNRWHICDFLYVAKEEIYVQYLKICQINTLHTHHTPNSSFLYMFQIVQPSVISWLTTTHKYQRESHA